MSLTHYAYIHNQSLKRNDLIYTITHGKCQAQNRHKPCFLRIWAHPVIFRHKKKQPNNTSQVAKKTLFIRLLSII